MNRSFLIGGAVVVAILVVIPLLAKVVSGPAGTGALPPEAASPKGTLDATSLVGTSWKVRLNNEPVELVLHEGGAAEAIVENEIQRKLGPPMKGTWSVEGPKLTATFFMRVGETYKADNVPTEFEIVGGDLLQNGQKIQRLR